MDGDGHATGGCACGALRYRLEAAPLVVHRCHCAGCQRETGSAFAPNAVIESDRLTVMPGEAERAAVPSASGKGQAVARCPACRVAAWSHDSSLRRRMAFVRMGTLDAPGAPPPGVHILMAAKRPCITLDPATPVSEA